MSASDTTKLIQSQYQVCN